VIYSDSISRYSDTLEVEVPTAPPPEHDPATVREAALRVMRERGLTTVFSNPGSTEVPFLSGLPQDIAFVLGLHEGAVVGMATGWAIARRRPALVLLHTTAGLGNAVAALATARVNRAPFVVLVGQQDRRHLMSEPFLAGRLSGLAGEYPVAVLQPPRAQDVPGAIARAHEAAVTDAGPAIVIVPMDDWAAPPPAAHERGAPARVLRPPAAATEAAEELAAAIAAAGAPALVVGAGADDPDTWAALVTVAERLGCPVWQESFGARAGFPQDHPQFAGNLPADRTRLRALLGAHDLVVVVGAPAFRQYAFEDGPLVPPGTRVAVVSRHPDEVHRSEADLALLADPAALCRLLATRVPARDGVVPFRRPPRPAAPVPPAPGEPLRAGHVLAALGERLPRDTVVVEETPSSRPELERRLPAREPLGYLSAAMGGLGFALPGAIGVRMARPARPVVAVVGDGSSLYQIQSLWSAARYGVGVLFVVLSNGRYAIMDRLAERAGAAPAWPDFEQLSIGGIARALGCDAETIADHDALLSALDAVVPTLRDRTAPLVLDVAVAPDPDYTP